MNTGYPNPSNVLDLKFKINRQARILYKLTLNGAEPDTTGWTWQLFVKRNAGDWRNVINLTLGFGLRYETYSETILVADFTALNTNLEQGEYYYELVRTDIEKTWIEGKAFFEFKKDDSQTGTESTYTVNVDSEGTVISIALTSERTINISTDYTFSNGITESGGAVKLGGTLTEITTINPSTFALIIGSVFGNVTFRSQGASSFFNIKPLDDDPSSPITGDVWINSGGQVRVRIGSTTYQLAVSLQDAYTNGDGIITLAAGKPLIVKKPDGSTVMINVDPDTGLTTVSGDNVFLSVNGTNTSILLDDSGSARILLTSDNGIVFAAISGGIGFTCSAGTGSFIADSLDFRATASALTDGSTIILTKSKHTLTTAQATITVTDSFAGDYQSLTITLSGITQVVLTFATGTALCRFEGTASGDNTMTVTGVSGDRIKIMREKVGTLYDYVGVNDGQ